MTRLDDDPMVARSLAIASVGVAVQVAAVTAYIPLALIGPDPDRGVVLAWVMPVWIVGVTIGATFPVRRAFRRFLR